MRSRRCGSAWSSSQPRLMTKRHGWVLCTDGASAPREAARPISLSVKPYIEASTDPYTVVPGHSTAAKLVLVHQLAQVAAERDRGDGCLADPKQDQWVADQAELGAQLL